MRVFARDANACKVVETAERKNALETYIYEMRDRLVGDLAQFVHEREKEPFEQKLNEVQDWLYTEEGEEATKSTYVAKQLELEKIGGAIVHRFRENDARPRAAQALRSSVEQFVQFVKSADAKWDHIPEADRKLVSERCTAALTWLETELSKQNSAPLSSDPVLLAGEINKKRESVELFCNPIMNRIKPKPKEEPKKEEPKKDEAKPDEAKPDAKPQQPANADVD